MLTRKVIRVALMKKKYKIKKKGNVKKPKTTRVASKPLFEKKEKMVVVKPKTTSDVIHCLFKSYDTVYNIFEIENNRYSMCIEYSDISFTKAKSNEQYSIFTQWVTYLNSLSSNVHVQVVNIGRPVRKVEVKNNFLFDTEGEHLNDNERILAKEFNRLIERSINTESEKQETKRYIVLSVKAENLGEARELLRNYYDATEDKFLKLKSRIRIVSVEEMMELIYDFFRTEKYIEESRDKTLIESIDEEHTIFDILAPKKIDLSKRDHFVVGDRYYRILYLSKLPTTTNPFFYNRLTTVDMDIVVTLNIQPQNNAKMIKKVDKIISGVKTERLTKIKRALKEGYPYGYVQDENLEDKYQAYMTLKNDLQKNGQKLFNNNMLICVMGESLDDINKKTNKLLEIAGERLIEISIFNYMQLEGIINLLPLGHNTLQLTRNLSSEATAANIPFNSKDLLYPKGIYYGENLVSHNAIFADRKKLLNGNGCVLGTAGGGKSFQVKQQIEQIILRYPEDDVVIIDPQSEYKPLIEALNGQEIEIHATSNTFINPFDLDLGYDDEDPVKAKTEYIIAFIESMVAGGLTGQEQTVIDRCTKIAYMDYEASGFKDKSIMPNLPLFYELLLAQPEREAKKLALIIERYVKGSLNIFAQETNVDINNRLVSFDISKLSSSLQTTGYLVILDYFMNRMAANKKAGKNTWLFIDEFHILLANQFSAEYIAKIYKVGRKYHCLPTIITQNIEDVLHNENGRKILSNSEFGLILKQKPLDLPNIQDIFKISNDEAEYLNDPPAGQGVLHFGEDNVIFKNIVDKESFIYKLNQTSTVNPGQA